MEMLAASMLAAGHLEGFLAIAKHVSEGQEHIEGLLEDPSESPQAPPPLCLLCLQWEWYMGRHGDTLKDLGRHLAVALAVSRVAP